MKKILIFVLFWGLAVGADAQERTFAGYKTYSPNDIAVKLMPSPQIMESLKAVRSLMKNDSFQFLSRQDADHWIGLTRVPSGVVLHIHDEDARFNFRALVDLKTGQVTVQKAVDYVGYSRQDDALYAARLALGYLERLEANKVLYLQKKMPAKPMASQMASQKKPLDIKTSAKTEKKAEAKPEVNTPAKSAQTGASTGAENPLEKLMMGNQRFVAGKPLHPEQDMKRVAETSAGQHPFAIVMTCSDSRLPPEVLFDQGVGDLFVVRTAGEVAGPLELASVEYAVEHLHVPYLLVLGHKKCGAVDAAIKGGDLSPDLETLVKLIEPAVERAKDMKGDLLDNAVHENIKEVMKTLESSKIVAEALASGKLKLTGAYYDIDTGAVAELR